MHGTLSSRLAWEHGALRRLALVHGFTQTRDCWGPIADGLGLDYDVVRLDAPGHGRASGVATGLEQGARLLAAEGGEATWIGYSMGGRYCLTLALAVPEAVRGLVLVGATAGIDDEAERAARVAADEALAARLETIGLDAFLDEWLRLPLFARLPAEATCLEDRRTNTVAGLAASLRLAGTGAQPPLWDRLSTIEVPVLVTAGQEDTKFAALGERLVSSIGANATLALVPGAGHTAHLEQPDAFLAILRRWLSEHAHDHAESARPAARRTP